MHEHANCLQQVLTILTDSNDLLNICPFSSLLNITPTDDDFFKYVKHDRNFDLLNNSEIVKKNAKHAMKFSMDGQDKKMVNSCGSIL